MTDHPHKQGMTYWSHMWHSLCVGFKFALASWGMIIHALLPFIFKDRPLSMGYDAFNSVLLEKRSVNVQKLMLQNIALKRALALATEEMCPEEANKVLEEIHKYEFD